MGRWCHCRHRHRHGWVRGPPCLGRPGHRLAKSTATGLLQVSWRRGPWRRGPEPCARTLPAPPGVRPGRSAVSPLPAPPLPAPAAPAAPAGLARGRQSTRRGTDLDARRRCRGASPRRCCHRRRRRGRRRRGRPRSVERRDVHERAERAERAETQASEEEQRRLQRGGDLDLTESTRGPTRRRRSRTCAARRRANNKTILENVARRATLAPAAKLRLRVRPDPRRRWRGPFARDATRAKDTPRVKDDEEIARGVLDGACWTDASSGARSISTTRC